MNRKEVLVHGVPGPPCPGECRKICFCTSPYSMSGFSELEQ